MGETALHIACAGPALPCSVWASCGDLRNWSWCFKAGMKLSIRSVQGLRLKEARWALSSCEWAVFDFGRGMRTQTREANQASCETFGSVTTWTFDMWGCCSWPHWGECKRQYFSGYFLGLCFFPFLINQAAFRNTCLTPQFFLLLECGCRVDYQNLLQERGMHLNSLRGGFYCALMRPAWNTCASFSLYHISWFSYWLHGIRHKTIKERLVCKAVLDRVLRGFWNKAIGEW